MGDVHAEAHDLHDAGQLGAYIINLAEAKEAMVVLSGDIYNDHGVINAEVQFFWYAFFESLRSKKLEALVIMGNHDRPNTENSQATSLIAHVEQATMVMRKEYASKGLLFCPYTKGETLIEWSKAHPECKTMFSHQTFQGSSYENGFYAGDGVEPDAILQELVISGHIHKPQEFGKILYPGAPRWRTLSDANVDRAIWLFEFDDTGHLLTREGFDTSNVCRKIYHLIDTEDAPVVVKPNPRHEYRIDSHGSTAWLETRKPVFAGWSKWRSVKTDPKTVAAVKESEGVDVAFTKWCAAFKPRYGSDPVVLEKMYKERCNGS